MMILEIENLTKYYTRQHSDFAAVSSINLKLEKSGFITLIGRSGSGKTTLLNMIAGLLTPDEGHVHVCGTDIYAMDDYNRSILRNKKIGYVPQGQSLIATMTVIDNIRLPFFLYSQSGSCMDRALYLLDKMGITHLKDCYPSSLSGGETRRVAIARALINEPDFIIADEPTSDLDVEMAQEIASLLIEVNGSGTALLIATHDTELTKMGKRILQIRSGILSEVN